MKPDLKLFVTLRTKLIEKTIEVISTEGFLPHITCFTEPIYGLPEHLYSEKTIFLNIAPEAIGSFCIAEDYISVSVRFSGKSNLLMIPLLSVVDVIGIDPNTSKPVLIFDVNNGFGVSNDLIQRYIDLCENGDMETKPEEAPPVKQKPHLVRIK